MACGLELINMDQIFFSRQIYFKPVAGLVKAPAAKAAGGRSNP